MSARLALGTVQFGLRYGVANRAGQVSIDEAGEILAQAWQAGIDTLDTAIAYGESESRLGQLGVRDWRIVSKLPALPREGVDVSRWVRDSVLGSLERLRVPRLHGLLLHEPRDLLARTGSALHAALRELKERGAVERIGVSIYDPEDLEPIVQRFRVDLVQAPFSVIDRRLDASGWLARLHEAGTEVHVRSVFLQGLLLMPPDALPAALVRCQGLWEEWHAWLAQQRLTAVQACLRYALSRAEIGRVIVGVDNLAQLREIVAGADGPTVIPPEHLESHDSDLINPSRWRIS